LGIPPTPLILLTPGVSTTAFIGIWSPPNLLALERTTGGGHNLRVTRGKSQQPCPETIQKQKTHEKVVREKPQLIIECLFPFLLICA
jgi:hypothetical protein